jgi:Holliday junction resolvase RusA-like endonuclease
MKIVVWLSGEPAAKGRAKFARIGRGAGSFVTAYTPKKTRDYEALIKAAGQESMNGAQPLAGPVFMLVAALLPIRASWTKAKQKAAAAGTLWPVTKPDTDNFTKIAKDALNGVAYYDDAQVVIEHALKRYSYESGLYIEIEPLGERHEIHVPRVQRAVAEKASALQAGTILCDVSSSA